jgi:hypothetical protein
VGVDVEEHRGIVRSRVVVSVNESRLQSLLLYLLSPGTSILCRNCLSRKSLFHYRRNSESREEFQSKIHPLLGLYLLGAIPELPVMDSFTYEITSKGPLFNSSNSIKGDMCSKTAQKGTHLSRFKDRLAKSAVIQYI